MSVSEVSWSIYRFDGWIEANVIDSFDETFLKI